MRQGLSPTAAAEEALNRIIQYYPKFSGALITINVAGEFGNCSSTKILLSQFLHFIFPKKKFIHFQIQVPLTMVFQYSSTQYTTRDSVIQL